MTAKHGPGPDNASWSKSYGHAAAVFNNKNWIMGGDNGSLLSDVWIQAMTTPLPGHKPPIRLHVVSTLRAHCSRFRWEIVGVWWKRGQRVFKLLEFYRRQCMVRSGAIAKETSRSGMGWAVMGNRLYISGGYIGNNTYKDDVKKNGP
ncbi:MAG: hypothetical protein Ct9H300mP28_17980 [Pseudomonadota bacterium]|nr:MAG: hypothetical protein Ct9H300mP28_17980 [Pseudomonadota bacterium]